MTQPPATPPTPPAPREAIAGALDDWWISAEPDATSTDAAQVVEGYLTAYGYAITRNTCDASAPQALGAIGPCILRHHHTGPVHQDANGATWWLRTTAAAGPGVATTLTTAFLAAAALTGAIAAGAHGAWGWAIGAAVLLGVFGHELLDQLTDHRNWTRT